MLFLTGGMLVFTLIEFFWQSHDQLTVTIHHSVTIIGILRVIAFSKFFWDPSYDFTNTWGPSYSSIEPNLAIIAASVPSLRPLLRKWFPGIFSQSSSKQTGRYHKHHDYVNASSGHSRSIHLQDLGQSRAKVQSGHSPDDSQEEIITSAGIMKTTMVSQPGRCSLLCYVLQLTRCRSTCPMTKEPCQGEVQMRPEDQRSNTNRSQKSPFDAIWSPGPPLQWQRGHAFTAWRKLWADDIALPGYLAGMGFARVSI